MLSIRSILLVLLVVCAAPRAVRGQAAPARDVSAKKAFALSLAAPGLGHRYVHGGRWRGGAAFALADAALWAGLGASLWKGSALANDYQTLAVSRAGAAGPDQPRSFYLNLATYRSQQEQIDNLLRQRLWDAVPRASDPANYWAWASEADFARYRRLRERSEALRRRAPTLAALLVANRFLSGLSALRAAGRAERMPVAVHLLPAPDPRGLPLVSVEARW